MTNHDDFVAKQDEHFADADDTHFAWQTRGPGFADREASFLRDLLADSRRPLLEIGCGEGANLFHIEREAAGSELGLAIGLDRSAGKLHFASAAVPSARFCCGDGTALPFGDGSFESVIIRDVLHHLPAPAATLAEAARVLRPGGRFVLAEPNAHNPLIRLQMALVPAERGAARSDEAWLRELLAHLPLTELRVDAAAPFPLDRVVLHPNFGLPRLGRSAATLRALDAIERIVGRLLGRARWSYVVAHARRAGVDGGSGPADMPP